jgi:hypothetical protein
LFVAYLSSLPILREEKEGRGEGWLILVDIAYNSRFCIRVFNSLLALSLLEL